jgi:elongation factor Ts
MSFSASDVKNLRDMTGAGMMACKEALGATSGNIEEAVDYLRKKGLAAAQKKQGRIAAEGAVASLVKGDLGVIVEVNCETDFVGKGEDFQKFAQTVAEHIATNKPADVETLKTQKFAGTAGTVGDAASELTLKVGEKIDVRRFVTLAPSADGVIGTYNHGGRIGVLVAVAAPGAAKTNAGVLELAKDLAMHVAAADPKFLAGTDIDEGFKQREAEIYKAQLKEEGKPDAMIEKIVLGKLNKLASEVCLLEQKFVKNPDLTVSQLVAGKAKELGADLRVLGFQKINLGEGIEKKQDNLAEEVAKLTGQQ